MPVEIPAAHSTAEIAEQPLLVVVGQDGGVLARLQPERDQARADRLGRLAVLAPGVGLPDAAVLLAQGDLVGLRRHAMPEQPRHRSVAVDRNRLSFQCVHVGNPYISNAYAYLQRLVRFQRFLPRTAVSFTPR